ncbi:uncharacterized protein EI90DRAFT_135215 [Cantharellus anzutake]|uniref:uncharacterized protein n=1 Tax=Cantharellus anzutake TaxID=1750568 RepID=UPI001905B82A|nr:uncharacterized protein EI90DRAFT_135215 [Cantharellus anzutake]KAF8318059.1 hypothetical protein EI90DRAFT_135215 [Cantharellus anzutake]
MGGERINGLLQGQFQRGLKADIGMGVELVVFEQWLGGLSGGRSSPSLYLAIKPGLIDAPTLESQLCVVPQMKLLGYVFEGGCFTPRTTRFNRHLGRTGPVAFGAGLIPLNSGARRLWSCLLQFRTRKFAHPFRLSLVPYLIYRHHFAEPTRSPVYLC